MARWLKGPGLALAGLLGLAAAAPGAPADHKTGGSPHWGYEGTAGPEHWGDLDASFGTCKSGHRQSPVDIPAAAIKAEPLDPIHFDYKAAPLRVTDNGHTVMVTYAPGNTIRVGSEEYELRQFHFHRPSEEKIDGTSFPLVAHLVHQSKEGRLAVVAVLFREGAASQVLTSVFGHLPSQRDKDEVPAGVAIDASALLPAKTSYFTFQGSLTTPPCTEGVTWYVLRETVPASQSQIAAFARRYPHNARPVQPIDGREIRASQ